MPEHAVETRELWLSARKELLEAEKEHVRGGDDLARRRAHYNFKHVDQVAPQREGMSAFVLRDGAIHHTYSTYARGVEQLIGTYAYLDVAPFGRNEDPENPGAWWHRHDEYETQREEARL